MKEGTVVQCIGAVIDVEFSREHLPKIYDALTLEEAGLTLEVQQQLGDGVVRTICLGSSDGLRRGMKVQNSGAPIMVPVGPKTLGRIMDVLGRPIDEAGPVGAEKTMSIHRDAPAFEELSPSTELLETGIKVIDLVFSAPTGPASSMGRPSTSMIRPSVFGPTGTMMGPPEFCTFMPRRSPSEDPRQMVRTTPSPSCCWTSRVSPASSSVSAS